MYLSLNLFNTNENTKRRQMILLDYNLRYWLKNGKAAIKRGWAVFVVGRPNLPKKLL